MSRPVVMTNIPSRPGPAVGLARTSSAFDRSAMVAYRLERDTIGRLSNPIGPSSPVVIVRGPESLTQPSGENVRGI